MLRKFSVAGERGHEEGEETEWHEWPQLSKWPECQGRRNWKDEDGHEGGSRTEARSSYSHGPSVPAPTRTTQ